MATSSAVPDDLLRYAQGCSATDEQVRIFVAQRLAYVMDLYRLHCGSGSHGEVGIRHGDDGYTRGYGSAFSLLSDLLSYVNSAVDTDNWVGTIGSAFLRAGEGELSAPSVELPASNTAAGSGELTVAMSDAAIQQALLAVPVEETPASSEPAGPHLTAPSGFLIPDGPVDGPPPFSPGSIGGPATYGTWAGRWIDGCSVWLPSNAGVKTVTIGLPPVTYSIWVDDTTRRIAIERPQGWIELEPAKIEVNPTTGEVYTVDRNGKFSDIGRLWQLEDFQTALNTAGRQLPSPPDVDSDEWTNLARLLNGLTGHTDPIDPPEEVEP